MTSNRCGIFLFFCPSSWFLDRIPKQNKTSDAVLRCSSCMKFLAKDIIVKRDT
jgi:hypothetical protein